MYRIIKIVLQTCHNSDSYNKNIFIFAENKMCPGKAQASLGFTRFSLNLHIKNPND